MLTNVKEISRENLLDEVAIHLPHGYRFVTMTCLDLGDSFEILYHFDKDYRLSHLRLRLRKDENLPTISGMVPAAVIVENEIKDLFGISVKGLSLDYGGRLLLAEGAPVAPLCKAASAAPDPAPKAGA